MKKKLLNVLKFIIFLAIGILLLWFIFRNQDFDELQEIITKQVDYKWILFALFFGMFGHISRAIRWNILIYPLGKKPRLINSILAVFIGYFANLALPRFGEFTRCGVLSKYENVSFSKLLGTVITERIFDLLMLFLFLIVAVVLEIDVFAKFWKDNFSETSNLFSKIFSSLTILLIVLGIIIIIWIFRNKIKSFTVYQKIVSFIKNIGVGIKSFKNIKHKKAFFFHSIFIWINYYLMFYMSFFAFEFTSSLSPIVALSLFVLGSLGFVAPVQGGLGAFHILVIAGFLIYLPNLENIETLSRSFTVVVHGAQTLMIIIFGFISVVLLPLVNRNLAIKNEK